MSDTELATFAGGCFWCLEAAFSTVKGVSQVVSGYTGGNVENPTYSQVCTGTTGHAEAVQITFDPKVISYTDLLTMFWRIHDPTTLDYQGDDLGTQYRSAIFCHSEEQKRQAEASKAAAEEAKLYKKQIVTEIKMARQFYPAERGHQNYYKNNPTEGYCRSVIAPKMKKCNKLFKDKLANNERHNNGCICC